MKVIVSSQHSFRKVYSLWYLVELSLEYVHLVTVLIAE
jgi:hypothetical protein